MQNLLIYLTSLQNMLVCQVTFKGICFSKNKHWDSMTILQSFSSILPSYMYGAFKEGWGLYSEYLGYDLGIYQNEPLKELGYIKGMD